MFLVTDKNNKTFGGFSWTEGSENETDNPNYYFRLYENLEAALYLSPFFGHEEFNIWVAEGYGDCLEERTCKKFSKVKSISLKEVPHVPDEKRIITAILCSMSLVKNDDFLKWCSLYLKEEDRSKESAFVIRESVSETDEESEYFSCALPLLSCVSNKEKVASLSAASIFRAVSDSIDVGDPIDLNKITKIVSFIPSKDIASMFS